MRCLKISRLILSSDNIRLQAQQPSIPWTRIYAIPLPTLQPIPMPVARDRLFQYLNINAAVCETSMIKVSQEGQRNEHVTECNRVFRQTLQHDAFKKWLTSNTSGLIALRRSEVDREESYAFRFFAATVVDILLHCTTATVVQFFCPIFDMPCPRGSCFLLRNLIHQLLQFPNSTSVPVEQLSMQTFDLHQLRNLFLHVLHSLIPGQTVFVIVHALAYYEDRQKSNSWFNCSTSSGAYPLTKRFG
jgi:hypothetical protein